MQGVKFIKRPSLPSFKSGITKSPLSSDSTLPQSPTTGSKFQHVQENLLYKTKGTLTVGQVYRFNITYTPDTDTGHTLDSDEHGEFLSLRVQNCENNLFRPIYLTGPFSFYIDITPYKYDFSESFGEKIQYSADIKPGVSFKGKLYVDEWSRIDETGSYSWQVDVVSQLALTTGFEINLCLMVGYDHHLLKKGADAEDCLNETVLEVKKMDTEMLWNQDPKDKSRPVHLIVLTHGIFSNVGADMLYLRDRILEKTKENEKANVIVRGYDGNIGKSEKGIKYLGKRVGDYVLNLYDECPYKVDRISFIGHSLGGPVQAYAIFRIASVRPDFFKKVIPVNFITLASPMLGILSEFPKYVSFALDIGMMGTTGRDLTLCHKFPSIIKKQKSINGVKEGHTKTRVSLKPVLERLLANPAHGVYERFSRRTTYANAINDGIVPLRTSALLYLDWRSLGQVELFKKSKSKDHMNDRKQQPETQENGKAIEDKDQKEERNTNGPVGNDSGSTDLSDQKKEKGHKNQVFGTKATTSFKSSSSHILIPKRNKRHKLKKYLRTQTIRDDRTSESKAQEISESLDNQETQDPEVYIPPVASTFLSAANVMLSPEPDNTYLTDPSQRPNTIFHDKIYHFSDLPQPHYARKYDPTKERSHVKNLLCSDKKAIQERLARSWHWHMDWRKVLVTLRPDAHNNIIVRRKYVNAWGWGVIENLVDTHFSPEALERDDETVNAVNEKSKQGE